MKQWSSEIEIDAPIEEVWKLFTGTLENRQRLTPALVDIIPLIETDEVVGSLHINKQQEGKHVLENKWKRWSIQIYRTKKG